MGKKSHTPGLQRDKASGIWHIDKIIFGRRIRESSQTSDVKKAEQYLAFRVEQARQAEIYGVRPKRLWRDAATKYLSESTKPSIKDDAIQLQMLDRFLGNLPLEQVHLGTLQAFIDWRRSTGALTKKGGTIKNSTINHGLQVVRHVLNMAAGEWRDEFGLTWLAHAPKIKLLRVDDRKEPRILSPGQQAKLFNELPEHSAKMALFAVNTGLRNAEVCNLRWDMELDVPALDTVVFEIPRNLVKNREIRLVVLNRVAMGIIDEMRGIHPGFVFTYRGKPVASMYNPTTRLIDF